MDNVVEFTGQFARDSETFGVNFPAKVGDENVVCKVSTEALQDIDPSNAAGEPEEQFIANQSAFEEIARRKILGNEVQNGMVFIRSSDV